MTIYKTARRSVVIVVDKRDDDYCSGCVMKIKDGTVTVIAPSKFVSGRNRYLKVVFFDRTELDATVIAGDDAFCLLTTVLHSGCRAISLLEDEHGLVAPQRTFIFIPQSCSITQKIYNYAAVKSLESYLKDETMLMANSTHYFAVTCAYFGKTFNGINRLTAPPVFTMSGKTAGIVLQDFRVDPLGAEVKVVLKARCLGELMMLLDPPVPAPAPAPPRKVGKKRKRRGIRPTH